MNNQIIFPDVPQNYHVDISHGETINHKAIKEFFVKYVSNTDELNEKKAEKILAETMESVRNWNL